jgi:hypothetical protein
MAKLGMGIDFAHAPFDWANEASGQAAVDVVIIGFSGKSKPTTRPLWVYPDPRKDGELVHARNINAYLLDAPEVQIIAAKAPLAAVPKMRSGNVPRDGGWLSKIGTYEAEEIRSTDPIAANYLRRLYGADELIQGTERWCLWLVDADPSHIRKSPVLRARLAGCEKERRGKAGSKGRAADTPALFADVHQPAHRFLCIPSVSSEIREYIPMAYLDPSDIINNAVFSIDDANPWLFGALSSRVFTAWVKAISSRLESRLQIGAGPVYNTFPFIEPEGKYLEVVATAAQGVLDARDAHPGSSLADLYDPLAMPKDLRDAHRALDREILGLYGLKTGATDQEILAALFTRYKALAAAEKPQLNLAVSDSGKPNRKTTGSRQSETAAIRAWAIANGYTAPPRGRLPKDVIEAYRNFQSQT